MCFKSGAGTRQGHRKRGNPDKIRGFSLVLQMMVGLPGDTPERLCRPAEKYAQSRRTRSEYTRCRAARHGALQALKRGEYTPPTVEEAVEICAGLLNAFIERTYLSSGSALTLRRALGREAVAGAYHPALGELVLSRLFRAKALGFVKRGDEEKISSFCTQIKACAMAGCRRENIIFSSKSSGLAK